MTSEEIGKVNRLIAVAKRAKQDLRDWLNDYSDTDDIDCSCDDVSPQELLKTEFIIKDITIAIKDLKEE